MLGLNIFPDLCLLLSFFWNVFDLTNFLAWYQRGGGGLAKYLTGKRAILYFCEITTIFYKPEDHDDVIKWKSAPELSFGSE